MQFFGKLISAWAILVLLLPLQVFCAESNDSSYDDNTKILSIKAVQAIGQYWQVTFTADENFHFHLMEATLLTETPDQYAIYSDESHQLSLIGVYAFEQYWNVILKQSNNTDFVITSVNPFTEASLKPEQRYKIQSDSTIIDTTNGLQWMRCLWGQSWQLGQCVGTPLSGELSEASYAAYNSDLLGYSDWRVPNSSELKTLVYCTSARPDLWNEEQTGCEGNYRTPTIATDFFPQSLSGTLWSNSLHPLDIDYYLTVDFSNGAYSVGYFAHANLYARFVRTMN